MVDVIDQLLFHFIGAVVFDSLLDRIAKSTLRLDGGNRSISAFQVDALVLAELFDIVATVDIAVAVVVAVENVASASNHFV